MTGHGAREAVLAAQGRAHFRGQRVVEGTVEVADLNQRRVDLPTGPAGGDDLDLAALAPGDQCRLGVDAVDAVDHAIDVWRDVFGHGLAGDKIRHCMHRAIRVDPAQAFGHDFNLGFTHGAVQRVQLPVGVADTDVIEIEQRNLADTTTGHGFRRPGTDATDANNRHMGRTQALQTVNAVQTRNACKPWIFCAHDRYLKNRRALWTTRPQVLSIQR
ncbi:hypothetical protein D3C73_1115090 [compost metagenome]